MYVYLKVGLTFLLWTGRCQLLSLIYPLFNMFKTCLKKNVSGAQKCKNPNLLSYMHLSHSKN